MPRPIVHQMASPGLFVTLLAATMWALFSLILFPFRMVGWFIDTFYDPRHCP